jgi:hypothetical protein
MELKQGLAWVDQAVRAHRGKPLSSLEIAVIRGACQGQTYEEIAIATAYSASYLSRSKIMGLEYLCAELSCVEKEHY